MAIDPKTLRIGDRFRDINWPQGCFCEVSFVGHALIGTWDDKREYYDWPISSKTFWGDCELIKNKDASFSHKEELEKIAERLAEIAKELRESP